MTMLTKQQIEALLDKISSRADDDADVIEDLARTALDILARLEDAKAAQALVIERAARDMQGFQDLAHENMRQWGIAISRAEKAEAERDDALARLAVAEGRVAALRKERDTWREGSKAQASGNEDLRARLAVAKGQVAELTEALEKIEWARAARAIATVTTPQTEPDKID